MSMCYQCDNANETMNAFIRGDSGIMDKTKVWNWQRVHNENASSQDWVYNMLMDKRITVLEDGAVKMLSDGAVANVGDYLVWFRDTDELRAVGKDDFESNYERMT